MKLTTKRSIQEIGATIRSVAQAQSSRLFKSEVNTELRSSLVFLVLRAEITVALLDLGLSLEQIMMDINPTDDILAQMIKDGYKFSLEQLRGEVR